MKHIDTIINAQCKIPYIYAIYVYIYKIYITNNKVSTQLEKYCTRGYLKSIQSLSPRCHIYVAF